MRYLSIEKEEMLSSEGKTDYRLRLREDNPERYIAHLKAVLQEKFANAGTSESKMKLVQLQNQIDYVVEHSHSSLAATVRIFEMMFGPIQYGKDFLRLPDLEQELMEKFRDFCMEAVEINRNIIKVVETLQSTR